MAEYIEPEFELPTREWECGECGELIQRFRGMGDISCGCGAEYNSFGQRLRDGWRNNSAWYNDDIDDMTGYEMEMASQDYWDGGDLP